MSVCSARPISICSGVVDASRVKVVITMTEPAIEPEPPTGRTLESSVDRVHCSAPGGACVAVDADVVGGRVVVRCDDRREVLHPQWLRGRSTEPGQIDVTNRQRLFTPVDIADDLTVDACRVVGATLVVEFSDGHRAGLDLADVMRSLGWSDDPEGPPCAQPWTAPLVEFPYVDWAGITADVADGGAGDHAAIDGDPDDGGRGVAGDRAVIECLQSFFRFGYVVVRNTPAVAGTVARVAERFGFLVGNNFGWTFDVQSVPSPSDLAYTSMALPAHTDQPYRRPVPGIQLLHCISNDAPGGDSTLVDGLAAAVALESEHPDLFAALVETEVEWRYDMGTDTVVNRGHVIELDRHDRYRQIRFNTKLDEPIVRPGHDLDRFYAARRWMTRWTNDPAHQVTFRLRPGDVMVMDNHRALHGRTAFDPTLGRRHLQGCYVEHDGLDTLYRLTMRHLRSIDER